MIWISRGVWAASAPWYRPHGERRCECMAMSALPWLVSREGFQRTQEKSRDFLLKLCAALSAEFGFAPADKAGRVCNPDDCQR